MRRVVCGCLALAGLSLLAPSAPSYDPWAWLIWGREILSLDLDTRTGPAIKPLALAASVPVALLGDAAPWAWLALIRAGAVLAVWLAFDLVRRLTRNAWAGALAALAVALTPGLARGAWAGSTEAIVIALALAAALALTVDPERGPRRALRLGAAAALLRVEALPLLALLALWLWRRDRAARWEVALLLAALPALWVLPELAGSGDALRSSRRARVIDDPGAPGLAELPFAAAAFEALKLVPVPLLLGAALASGPARRVAAGAAIWVATVAAMAELGYSGEARYSLPAAAVLAAAGVAGLAQAWERIAARPRRIAAAALAIAALTPWLAAHAGGLRGDARALADQAELTRDLGPAIAAAGGAAALARCGRPFTGPRRGPLVAWRLRVPKPRVGFTPAGRGVVLVSRLRRDARPEPAVPSGYERRATHGRWEVWQRCE